MRTWTRAVLDTACGGPCGGTVKDGQPMLLLALRNGRPKVRCAQCAGEPVPADIPGVVAAPRGVEPPFERLGFLPLRAIDVGLPSREPGEDG